MPASSLAALTEKRDKILGRLNTEESEPPIQQPKNPVTKKSKLRLAGRVCGRTPICDKPPGHRGSCKGSNNGTHRKPAVALQVASCRVCGCTDADCRVCVEKTGKPCYWVESDLCSACLEEPVLEPERSSFAPRLVEGDGFRLAQ